LHVEGKGNKAHYLKFTQMFRSLLFQHQYRHQAATLLGQNLQPRNQSWIKVNKFNRLASELHISYIMKHNKNISKNIREIQRKTAPKKACQARRCCIHEKQSEGLQGFYSGSVVSKKYEMLD
jgi:hypothetical protein